MDFVCHSLFSLCFSVLSADMTSLGPASSSTSTSTSASNADGDGDADADANSDGEDGSVHDTGALIHPNAVMLAPTHPHNNHENDYDSTNTTSNNNNNTANCDGEERGRGEDAVWREAWVRWKKQSARHVV